MISTLILFLYKLKDDKISTNGKQAGSNKTSKVL